VFLISSRGRLCEERSDEAIQSIWREARLGLVVTLHRIYCSLAGGCPAASHFLCCAAKKVTQENAPHIPALRVPESRACRAGGEELAPLLFYFRSERGSNTFAALFRPTDSGFGGAEGEKVKTRLAMTGRIVCL
jgi:hypothetical protein